MKITTLLRHCFVFMLCIGVIAPAKAAPTPMSPELKAFLMRPDVQRGTVDMMSLQWKVLVPDCADSHLDGTNVMVNTPPEFNAAGLPISGRWRVMGQFSGCNKNRLFNIQFYITPKGDIQRTALLPGTTIASAVLQHDSLMYVVDGMYELQPKHDCKEIQFTDTKFVAFEKEKPPTATGPVWKEKWTIRMCEVTGVVTLHFVTDAHGTNIVMDAKETERVDN